MKIDTTFYVKNISVKVNVARKKGDNHFIEIFAERGEKKECVLKNYPCELSSNAAINVSSNEKDNKIKLCILKDASNLEDYVIAFEFFVDGSGYIDFPSKLTEYINI